MATGVVLNIRIPESTHDTLATLAKVEQRSITAMARLLIEEAIEVRLQEGGGSRRREGGPEQEERVESALERLMGQAEKSEKSRAQRKGEQ
jgi:hypothetical protein